MTAAVDLRALRVTPDARTAAGSAFRLGLRRTVRTWGLELTAPPRLVSRRDRDRLRLGKYENVEAGVAASVLDPGLPLVELGAGIGAVSCFLNRRLADPSAHLAVEMDPAAVAVLGRNGVRNGCRFRPVQAALAYPGTDPDRHVDWLPRAATGRRSWSPARAAPPPAAPPTTLAALLAAAGWSEVNLVADAEGAELGLVEHELDVLRRSVRRLALEVHPHRIGLSAAAGLVRTLQGAGFELVALGGNSVFGFRRG